MQLFRLIIPFLVATLGSAKTVYLIRHGEKPADGGNGLTIQGMQRAQCLRSVFGALSQYNIGYIIAQQPKASGKRTRPLMTVQPIANDLGLTVDTSCDRDDADCVAILVDNYSGTGNILLCWEHDNLSLIAEAMGDKSPPTYPDDS
ncbi:related to phosphoglycerate mutase family protein [Rhynchosporium agropyri]|uniref:Related to phosphoglycerate mutase family protein n=1 Tax=Rhynchosporium agropyri TaxID=914238 RepID=A0A1E1KI94_9HELO|nr:related to phosphoglycerate mutase family protein [Rhynchosporium agropyri]